MQSGNISGGDWAACLNCSELIDRGDIDEMVKAMKQSYFECSAANGDSIELTEQVLRVFIPRLRKDYRIFLNLKTTKRILIK